MNHSVNVSNTYGYSQVLGIDYPAAAPYPDPRNGIFLVRETFVSSFPVVEFLAPGWNATAFLTPDIPTRAIAFDSSDKLYIEDTSDDNSGAINVLQLTAASGYTGSISYAAYPATHDSTTLKVRPVWPLTDRAVSMWLNALS